MRRITPVLLVVLLAAAVYAADGDAPETPNRRQLATVGQTKELTEAFLQGMISGRSYDAFNQIRNVMPDQENQVETWRAEADEVMESVRPSYGRPIGFELLDTKALGASYVRYDYLLKCEYQAVHYRVIYYSAKSTWTPVFMMFNTNLDPLYTALGK